MIELQEARRIAQSWIEAFNAKDLARLLDHYATDVELISPMVSSFTGGRCDRLSGIAALRDYFATGFAICPRLKFTLLDVSAGAGSLSIRYHSTLDDRFASECMELDGQGRAIRVLCHYSANDPSRPQSWVSAGGEDQPGGEVETGEFRGHVPQRLARCSRWVEGRDTN